jgi:hypothetical protein
MDFERQPCTLPLPACTRHRARWRSDLGHRAGPRLGTLGILLLLVLILSGCMRVERSFTLNADGSGVYALTIGVRYPKAGDPTSIPAQSVTALEAFGTRVQQQGGSYARTDDQGYASWTYTRPFRSVTQADEFLQEDPRQDDSSHTLVLYHDTLHVTTQTGALRPTTYHVAGTISLLDLTGNAAQYWSDATETLTITMANGVRAHRGGTQDGNSVTYKVAYNQSATVDVTGNVSQTNTAVIATLALVIALLALALAILGVWLLRRAARMSATASRVRG